MNLGEHLQLYLSKTIVGRIEPLSVSGMLRKTNSILPKIPFLGSLNIRLSCQTSSNAFEMFQKTPRTSNLSSNELYISCVIDKIDLVKPGYYQ